MGSKQTMLEPVTEGDGSLGIKNGYSTSNTELLKELFPSPLAAGGGAINDATLITSYNALLNGAVVNGYQFDKDVNMTFTDSPNIPGITYKEPGDPASGYVPNPMSPGADNGLDPKAVPKPPEGYGAADTASDTPFVGNNIANPNTTSKSISEAAKIGDSLIKGHSYAGSGE